MAPTPTDNLMYVRADRITTSPTFNSNSLRTVAIISAIGSKCCSQFFHAILQRTYARRMCTFAERLAKKVTAEFRRNLPTFEFGQFCRSFELGHTLTINK